MENNADSWVLMAKNCKKIVVYPKMCTIFSKIVSKQCLHACDFFHVWTQPYVESISLEKIPKSTFNKERLIR